VLCASDGNLQAGVDAAVELLRASVERFEAAATKLALQHADNEALAEDIAKFAQGCRCMCTGSYTWRSVRA
jgi:threonine dehydratase